MKKIMLPLVQKIYFAWAQCTGNFNVFQDVLSAPEGRLPAAALPPEGGGQGDALHVIGCAADYNLRWLPRWIAFLWVWIQGATAACISGQRSMRVAAAA